MLGSIAVTELIPTADPHIFIEEQRHGYVRYRRITDGRRWTVEGTCDRRGDCLIGAVVKGVVVRDHAHLAELGERPDSELDVPVLPEFDTCCGADRFRYVELEPS